MMEWRLLREYVEHGSDAAFAALVERYINLVYSTCLRELRDASLAEDVTQVVFLILAQKAKQLREGTILTGWLYRTARFACNNARQQEARRQKYEQHVVAEMMEELPHTFAPSADAVWQGIDPLLHEALDCLNTAERHAVLLRYFDGRTLRETGVALNISEEAARKRVDRAIDKMRRHFAGQGVAVSGLVLATLLAGNAAQAAPASCLAATLQTTSAVALQASTAYTIAANVQALWQGTTQAMLVQKAVVTAIAIATAGVAGVGATWLFQASVISPVPAVRLAAKASGAFATPPPVATPAPVAKVSAPPPNKDAAARPAEEPRMFAPSPGSTSKTGQPFPPPRGERPVGPTAIATGNDMLLALLQPQTIPTRPPRRGLHPKAIVPPNLVTPLPPEVEPEAPRFALQQGHAGIIDYITFSRDGRFLASAGRDDKAVKVWDAVKRELLMTLPEQRKAFFPPNRDEIATVSFAKVMHYWDLKTGRRKRSVNLDINGSQYRESVTLSPDGKTVADVKSDKVWIYDAVSGQALRSLDDRIQTNHKLAYSPDSKLLAAKDNARICIWEIESGTLLRTMRHGTVVGDIAFSPDGKLLASSSIGGQVHLWDVRTGRQLRTFRGTTLEIRSVAFSPDGKVLAAGASNALTLWDIESGNALPQPAQPVIGGSANLAFAPVPTASADGQSAAAGYTLASTSQNHITLIDSGRQQVLGTLKGVRPFELVSVMSGAGKWLFRGSVGNQLFMWDTQSGAVLRTFYRGPFLLWMAASGDGGLFATVHGTERRTLAVWNTVTGALVRKTDLKFDVAGDVNSNVMVLNTDGGLVATACSDGATRIFDTVTGDLKHVLAGHRGQHQNLAFSPDSKRLATGGADRIFRLWDVATGRLIKMQEEQRRVSALCFSPDGQTLARSRQGSGGVELCDGSTGEFRQMLATSTPDVISSIAFSSDGKSVLANCESFRRELMRTEAKDGIYLWDVATGRRKPAPLVENGSVEAVSFSPDNSAAICAMNDGSTTIWDLRSRSLRATLMVLSFDNVRSDAPSAWVAFTPQGYYNASPGANEFIHWKVGGEVLPSANISKLYFRSDLVQMAIQGTGILTAEIPRN